jgi:hypothetical protein
MKKSCQLTFTASSKFFNNSKLLFNGKPKKFKIFNNLRLCSDMRIKSKSEDYDNIIKSLIKDRDKYRTADRFDSLIKNSIHTDDKETHRLLCKKIANVIFFKAFREMQHKTIILCEEIVKVDPYFITIIPYELQSYNLCETVVNLSFGQFFKYIDPKLQTYELVLKAVEFDGSNIDYVRKDLINEYIKNVSSLSLMNTNMMRK